MKFLGGYAILAATVFGEGDTGGTRSVTFETVSEDYLATQRTKITFPILTTEWANVAPMAGTIESDLTDVMKTRVETQCTTFSDDWPTYTFSLADLGLVYTEDFTEPNVGITFSVSIDVKYEVQKATRKNIPIIWDDVATDTGYRVTELVNAAATSFASSVTASKFTTTIDGTATVSTPYDDATVEEEVNACVDNPCSTDANVHYTCTDIAGEDNTAAGRTCVDNFCATETCNGRGTCSDAQCTCDPFTLSRTEILDPNSSTCETVTCGSECLKGAMCTNVNGSPVCDCASATYDNTKEISDTTAADCAAKPCPGTCLNGGLCKENDNSEAVCFCKVESRFSASFFTGDLCDSFNFQTMVDEIIALTAADVDLGTRIDTDAETADKARSDLTTKINDLKSQASETDEKIEGLGKLITSNEAEIKVLDKNQKKSDTEIKANSDLGTKNAADILAENEARTADDNALHEKIETAKTELKMLITSNDEEIKSNADDIDSNSAAIQVNTDNDDDFRDFSWSDGVESIYNMIKASSFADMNTQKENLKNLINATSSSSD